MSAKQIKPPNFPMEIDSIDELRKAMIKRRDACFSTWPEGINDTVLFSHVIAALGWAEALHQWFLRQEYHGK